MSDFEPSLVSPCIAICRMDSARGWCEGCLRTLDEIAAWGSSSTSSKRAVLRAVEQRRVGAPFTPAAPASSPAPANSKSDAKSNPNSDLT